MVERSPLHLPQPDGRLQDYRATGTPLKPPTSAAPISSRVAYAATHVVCDALKESASSTSPFLDWDATLAFRRYLWSLGLGVAEAMDTAQRGMGLTWPGARDLIRRSLAEANAVGGLIACGVGTDQLDPFGASLEDVLAAYEEQCSFVESEGGRVILMASRALARCARSADDYATVYEKVLSQLSQPAIVHWLGDMFDPELGGYWGSHDLDLATHAFVDLVEACASHIEGVKVSLLDKGREIEMRARLPEGVRVYTGDDFNYAELIRGDDHSHSDALLGIFDAIAPAASIALRALDRGDSRRFEEVLEPTVPLSRHIFSAPTRYYKTGIVFLAYLNGHQTHFRLLGGLESARSVTHLAEVFVLADRSGLLRDPELATDRMRTILTVAGVH